MLIIYNDYNSSYQEMNFSGYPSLPRYFGESLREALIYE